MNKTIIFVTSLVILLLSVFAFAIYSYQYYVGWPIEDYDIKYIKMSRSACYGTCPVYSIEIDEDGDATYFGDQYVNVLGKRNFKLSNNQLRALQAAVKDARYFSLRDDYDCSITDMPSTTTIIKTENQEKEVYNYCGAPERLHKLEDKIDEITGIQDYIKYSRHGGFVE